MATEARIFTILIVLHALRYAIYAIRYCTLYAIRNTKAYVRNFTLFLQNEPKFRKSQMNLNNVLTTNYVKWTLGKGGKNEAKTPNSNPISAQKPPFPNLPNPELF